MLRRVYTYSTPAGHTATQKLRDAGYQKPIIALTAQAMNDIRKRALNVGSTDHLTKPINPNDLIRTITKYTDLQAGAQDT